MARDERNVQDELRALSVDLAHNRIDRKGFLRRAGALGISSTLASSVLLASEGAVASEAAPRAAQTLVYGPLGDTANYDTITNGYDYSSPPFSQIYEGLTTYVPGKGWNASNLLASSLEKSKDGRTYAFKLKSGVEFHGGFGELTANDVKYTFERAAGKQKVYPNAPKSIVSYYGGDMPGLVGVKVTGKYAGQIVFKEPFAPFDRITLPYATSGMIVSQKAIAKYGAKAVKTPIGTGPYEVASYTPNQQMVMQKFGKYSGLQDALGAKYDFDEIRFVMTALNAAPKGQALTVPLQSGSVDFTPALSSLDTKRLASNSGFNVYAAAKPLDYFYLALDVKNPKLKDVRVRQAIAAAIDVDQVIQANRYPASTRLDALIAKQMGVGYWAGAPRAKRDVAKAKSLLKAAGVSKLSINLATPSIANVLGDPNAVMQVIQSNLKDAGITVNIIETPPDSYVAKAGFGELAWSSFGGAPDPYYQFEWFTCSQIGVWNYASWCNPVYGRLENKLGTTSDPAARGRIAIQMQKLMQQGQGFLWMHTGVLYAAGKKNVGAVFDTNGNPALQYFKAM
jgi:peptide/nickel transport system substrate-binding protein